MPKLKQIFNEKPSYLKKGDQWLSEKFGCTCEEAKQLKEEIKGMRNINENKSDYFEFLEEAGIDKDKIKSTKFWQTQKGDVRYSVVTKEEDTLPNINEVVKILGSVVSPLNIKRTYEESDKVLVVYTSDKHIGANTSEDAMYENNYNKEEVRGRMSKVLAEIYKVYKAEGRLDKIIVCDLGDDLDGYNGFTTRGGHKLPQNMTNKEAFETYIDVHKAFYKALYELDITNYIDCYHLSDSNHGGEFDYFANRSLQEWIKLALPGMNFEICNKFINIVEEDNFTLLLTHGKDEKDMNKGLPLNLDVKTENYIKDFVIDNKLKFDNLHVIKGDLHQSSTNMSKHFRYRNVPSIYGSSKWIMTNFGLTRAGCGFDLFEGSEVKQWDIWM